MGADDNGRREAAWTDSHCHLQDLEGLDGALVRATAAGVHRVVCIGTSLASSERGGEIATSNARDDVAIWSSIGLHPHDASAGTEAIAGLLASSDRVSTHRPKAAGSVVAVGECGLDLHYEYSPRDAQLRAFAEQIALARTYDLALVIHTREAWPETLDVLAHETLPGRVIIHCFTGGVAEAKRCLDLGAYLSFSGIVTFKNAADVRLAAITCPPDRLLVETDTPYLAPVPHRGSTNEPAYVALVGEAIAELRGIDPVELASVTSRNTGLVFGLAE